MRTRIIPLEGLVVVVTVGGLGRCQCVLETFQDRGAKRLGNPRPGYNGRPNRAHRRFRSLHRPLAWCFV